MTTMSDNVRERASNLMRAASSIVADIVRTGNVDRDLLYHLSEGLRKFSEELQKENDKDIHR